MVGFSISTYVQNTDFVRKYNCFLNKGIPFFVMCAVLHFQSDDLSISRPTIMYQLKRKNRHCSCSAGADVSTYLIISLTAIGSSIHFLFV